jgi:hypothetical protein
MPVLSIQNVQQQEDAALRSAEKSLDSINLNVKPEIQALYDRICSIYSSRWRNDSIEILDEYLIEPPYDTVKIISNKEGSGIDRIKKMVSFSSLQQLTYF